MCAHMSDMFLPLLCENFPPASTVSTSSTWTPARTSLFPPSHDFHSLKTSLATSVATTRFLAVSHLRMTVSYEKRFLSKPRESYAVVQNAIMVSKGA